MKFVEKPKVAQAKPCPCYKMLFLIGPPAPVK
jgi:hypothetical protein